MGDVVLHAPGIAREPKQRIGGPAHQMVQAACPKVRAVIGVVHHAERDQRRPENQPAKAEQTEPQAGVAENENQPRAEQHDERDHAFGIQLRSAARAGTRVGQVLVDLATRLPDELAAGVERKLRRALQHLHVGDTQLLPLSRRDDTSPPSTRVAGRTPISFLTRARASRETVTRPEGTYPLDAAIVGAWSRGPQRRTPSRSRLAIVIAAGPGSRAASTSSETTGEQRATGQGRASRSAERATTTRSTAGRTPPRRTARRRCGRT